MQADPALNAPATAVSTTSSISVAAYVPPPVTGAAVPSALPVAPGSNLVSFTVNMPTAAIAPSSLTTALFTMRKAVYSFIKTELPASRAAPANVLVVTAGNAAIDAAAVNNAPAFRRAQSTPLSFTFTVVFNPADSAAAAATVADLRSSSMSALLLKALQQATAASVTCTRSTVNTDPFCSCCGVTWSLSSVAVEATAAAPYSGISPANLAAAIVVPTLVVLIGALYFMGRWSAGQAPAAAAAAASGSADKPAPALVVRAAEAH